MAPQSDPLAILNRIHAMHERSLPMYLASAPPWTPNPDCAELVTLRHVAEDQQLMADRIGSVIVEHGGTVDRSEFPMEFTDLHDLSIDFLIPQVRRRQEQEIEYLRRCITQLQEAPAPRAIAEEALGAAIAHLDNLKEVTRPILGIAG